MILVLPDTRPQAPAGDIARPAPGTIAPGRDRQEDPVMSHDHHHANGPTGAGSVVLELGGEIGVLVLHAPAELHGQEIEISKSAAEDFRRTHSLVRERQTSSGVSFAAVYPGVPAGEYTIWRDPDTPAGTVTIVGGEVSRFTWPG
jgi:hypothetical protein